jgi:myo-inositol-1(or 4)-monophosphatase
MNNEQLNSYLEFAKDLAGQAGSIMERYFKAEDIGTILKEDATPLTVADTAINDLVIEEVKKRYLEHGVIGEEASYMPERDFVWVVDPIDGTIPFSLAMPLSTFSLGLVSRKDGQPLVGVIFDPFLKHLYWSVQGQGAFLNETKINTSNQETLDNSYVSILGTFGGDSKTPGTKLLSGSYITAMEGKGSKHFSLLSQAYSAARVASGELAGSIFAYGSPWDSAAAALIVSEAGGIVTDLKGKVRRYDKFENGCLLSANQAIHKQLLEVVSNAHNSD